MKFLWTTLGVKNLDESVAFYRDVVGLGLERRFPAGPGAEIAFMGDGETKVELMCRAGGGEPIIGPDISIGFEVESLDDKMASLREKGVPIHSGPFQPNPSVRFIFVQDPNGLRVQFVEHLH